MTTEELIQAMISKGYIVQKDDGKYSPSVKPPPENELEILKKFWTFLHIKVLEKRQQEKGS